MNKAQARWKAEHKAEIKAYKYGNRKPAFLNVGVSKVFPSRLES